MTLKERILNQQPLISKQELDDYDNSDYAKQDNIFLTLCERLENNIDLTKVYLGTYLEIFNAIEDNEIDVTDIVSNKEYAKLKKALLSRKAQYCPTIGNPDLCETYDFSKEDDYLEFVEKYGDVTI